MLKGRAACFKLPYGHCRLALICALCVCKAAEKEHGIALVEVVVPLEELNARAMKMAKAIVRSPEAGVRFAKKGINLTDESCLRAGQIFEQAQSTYCCGTEDMHNAVNAYKAMIASKGKK